MPIIVRNEHEFDEILEQISKLHDTYKESLKALSQKLQNLEVDVDFIHEYEEKQTASPEISDNTL